MSTRPLSLKEIPFETLARQLACSANFVAAKFGIRRVGRWPWSKLKELSKCAECRRTWLRDDTPRHADHCAVGRTRSVAQHIIELGAGPLPAALQYLQHNPDERSAGAERRRTSGDSSGVWLDPAPSYQEPWCWDEVHHELRDAQGMCVARFVGTDLSFEAQREIGERIAACVNLMEGLTNDWAIRMKAAATSAEKRDRRQADGIVLDMAIDAGWFVEENGTRIPFHENYDGAEAYFATRVHLAREAARSRA